MQDEQLLAIDIGYGWTKGQTPGKPLFIEPSLVSLARDIRFQSDLGGGNGITVKVGKNAYFVGAKAELQGRGGAQTMSADRTSTDEYMALFYAAASELVKVDSRNVMIVTGLPVADFDQTNKDKLINLLRGEHLVERDGRKTRRFTVNQVAVIPQAVGALWGMILDKDGQATRNIDLRDGRVAVVDVGQFTTNLVTLDKLRYVDPLSTSHEVGVSRMLLDLQRDLRDEYGLSLDKLSLVDKAVRDGSVIVRGQENDIGSMVQAGVDGLAEIVLNHTRSQWGEGVDLSAVVLTGGGAHLLADRLREVYPHLRVADDCQFGNVHGYLRLAMRKMNKG